MGHNYGKFSKGLLIIRSYTPCPPPGFQLNWLILKALTCLNSHSVLWNNSSPYKRRTLQWAHVKHFTTGEMSGFPSPMKRYLTVLIKHFWCRSSRQDFINSRRHLRCNSRCTCIQTKLWYYQNGRKLQCERGINIFWVRVQIMTLWVIFTSFKIFTLFNLHCTTQHLHHKPGAPDTGKLSMI